MECDFRRRLRYGDRIDIEVRVIHIGQTSITWGYQGYRVGDGEETVVQGSNVTVCVKTDSFEKTNIPEWLRQGLKTRVGMYEKE
jgi:4-hydroxybenzoyl-CoA thioesterase